jgi:hypothetical protein
MSLIQEALQRQREEGGGRRLRVEPKEGVRQSRPPQPPAPPLPPVMPEPEQEEEPAPEQEALPHTEIAPPEQQAEPEEPAAPEQPAKTRAWPTLLIVLTALLLLVGGAVWMLIYAFRQLGVKSPEGTPAPVEIAMQEPVVDVPDSPQDTTPEAPPLEQAQFGKAEVDRRESTEPRLDEPPMESPIDQAMTASAVSTDEEPASATRNEEPLIWPSISMSASLGQGKNGAAILNGQIIDVGRSIDGVTLVAVGQQNATLEYEGQRMVLRVGNSTR